MKIRPALLTFFFSSIFMTAFGQTGFYRNLFGDNNTNVNTTSKLISLDPISGGRHFAGTSERTYADYFSCILYDNNFSPIWTASYQAGPEVATNFISNGIELDNGTIVSHCIHQGYRLFVGHDSTGNLLFSRYYGANFADPYLSGAMVESSENDSSYVVLFTECAVKHGLAKFDKNGDVLWSYENSVNGSYNAFVYTLDHAVNSGYISGGGKYVPILDSINIYAYLLVSNNDGTFKKAKQYEQNSNQYNTALIKRILTLQNDTYFVNFLFGKSSNGINETKRDKTIAQLDSNLNILHEWELSVPDTNQAIHIENLAEATEGKILISGYIKDDVNYPSNQYFLLKFNPNAPGGEIEWCKKFDMLYNNQSWSSTSSNDALYSSEVDDQIIFSYNTLLDGSCVSSIDQNGDGHCLSSDRAITHVEVQNMTSLDFTIPPDVNPIQPFDVPLTPYTAELKDTVYCSLNSTGLYENEVDVEIIELQQIGAKQFFKNVSNNTVDFLLYTMAGEVILQKELQVGELLNAELHSNRMYLFKAYSAEGNQIGRVLMTE